ncbi:MAG: enoyl-CoA hydratase/isomerase family protein [Verrucomicrobiota bacterium]|nr:enoyl-CoA hydratase/isomerase family protein [Verrucomicrobiota bacterium]
MLSVAKNLAIFTREILIMPNVLIEETGGVTTLTLNRPERRNALTIELMTELTDAVAVASTNSKQRVLILRGAGKAFCAGMDLNETAMPERAHQSADLVAKSLLSLSQTRLITIAQVHGAAVAGGAGLMSTCDFVVAAAGTKIGYPEAKRGLVAGLVMTFLRRQLRERDLRELLFTGDLITAERACEIGLVNRVVPPNDLEAETQKIVTAVLQNAPGALASAKGLMEELWSTSVQEDVETALRHHMEARESAEAKEGIAAYLEKRPPNWT